MNVIVLQCIICKSETKIRFFLTFIIIAWLWHIFFAYAALIFEVLQHSDNIEVVCTFCFIFDRHLFPFCRYLRMNIDAIVDSGIFLINC